MKLQIRHKLFFTLLLTSIVVSSGMFLFMQWSFDRGFLNYVNNQELQELDQLSERLMTSYAEHGSWNFLVGNPFLWEEFLRAAENESARPEPRMEQRGNRPAGLPPKRGPRVALYDAQKQSIFGPPAKVDHFQLQPLLFQKEVVGYLAILPVEKIFASGDLLFVEEQTESFALIALVMAVLSLLLAYPLTIHLLRPIKELTAGTRKLIAGEYNTRIPIITNDELAQLSTDFNSLARTLEKNEEIRRQWVADISHELRTPLAILHGEVEALQDGIRQPGTETFAALHSETTHLGRLVDDLYKLSMSDSGALNYKRVTLNPVAILTGTIELFESRFAAKNIQIHNEISPGCAPLLLADPDRLQQLFSNLMENSLRYTDSPGQLTIRMALDKENLFFYFEDSAPGVADEQLSKLFDRLYRGESSRNRANGGVGLGMAICSNIVEAHQGEISASHSSMQGLAITIKLPL
ncbi:two-component system, OmpR family, sensor histidine kinase BaeS [Desulfuromusa kysingii]|uniref:histidine kinase n=1 Tax=Desulfuromusa kysingii TaxID=37625 RepID=A0A1H3W7D3_9BACT|nr:ATP-binding protein [Desulfuromusa kysingii]SDZ83049.1 two-component system, OmpR family, sensor histidine kinase BaeS [Desulfuromusa kysingii]